MTFGSSIMLESLASPDHREEWRQLRSPGWSRSVLDCHPHRSTGWWPHWCPPLNVLECHPGRSTGWCPWIWAGWTDGRSTGWQPLSFLRQGSQLGQPPRVENRAARKGKIGPKVGPKIGTKKARYFLWMIFVKSSIKVGQECSHWIDLRLVSHMEAVISKIYLTKVHFLLKLTFFWSNKGPKRSNGPKAYFAEEAKHNKQKHTQMCCFC